MPKFPKSSGFKMKGYTYPGTSPIKEAEKAAEVGEGGVDLGGLATQAAIQIGLNALQTGTINSEKRVRANKIKAEAANFPTPQTTTKIV
jgi:hypothetical protein